MSHSLTHSAKGFEHVEAVSIPERDWPRWSAVASGIASSTPWGCALPYIGYLEMCPSTGYFLLSAAGSTNHRLCLKQRCSRVPHMQVSMLPSDWILTTQQWSQSGLDSFKLWMMSATVTSSLMSSSKYNRRILLNGGWWVREWNEGASVRCTRDVEQFEFRTICTKETASVSSISRLIIKINSRFCLLQRIGSLISFFEHSHASPDQHRCNFFLSLVSIKVVSETNTPF